MTQLKVFISVVLAIVATNFAAADETSRRIDAPQLSLDLTEPMFQAQDRIWKISTRHLTTRVCNANLESPDLRLYQLETGCQFSDASWDRYFRSIQSSRKVVVYVHGNRIQPNGVVERGLRIHRSISKHRCNQPPVDWVIWSWPSSKQGVLIHDARRKAEVTDVQGLYLSWLLGEHAKSSIPTTLIGYSFGARVVTGALHALAGGPLGGRTYPGETFEGMNFDAGLVAPAIQSNWMSAGGYHGRSAKNLNHLMLFYNRRDVILKRYWLLDRVRGAMALGYSGPTAFAPRSDGSKLLVRSRDCSTSVGLHHREVEYYASSCHAGSEIAGLIHDTLFQP